MSIALNGTPTSASSGSGGTTATSPAISVPSGAVIGEWLYWFSLSSNAFTLTTPTGWTAGLAQTFTTAATRISVFGRRVDGTEAGSYDVTASGATRWCMGMFRVSGVDPASPGASAGTESENAASTTAAHPGLTINKDGNVAVWICGFTTSSGTTQSVTPPSGFSEVLDVCTTSGSAQNKCLAIAVRPIASAGATGACDGAITESVANHVVMTQLNLSLAWALRRTGLGIGHGIGLGLR